MSEASLKTGDGLPIFFICEVKTSVTHGLDVNIGSLNFNPMSAMGLSGKVIRREVAQAVREKVLKFEGSPVETSGQIARAWLLSKIIPSADLVERYTDNVHFVTVWRGNVTKSVGVKGFEWKFKSGIVDTLPLGGNTDPISDVRLYGNQNIIWSTGAGGSQKNMACAVYDAEKGKLTQVPDMPKGAALQRLLAI